MSTQTVANEKITPAYMAHVVLRTKRYREMIDWYSTVFHAEPLFESDVLTFMTFDDEHHRFAFLNMPPEAPEPTPNAVGVAHYAYSYASTGDLLRTYKRLKSEGIKPTWSINHGLTLSLYYTDPDGNEMEFQRDNFKTMDECKAFFTTETYLQNPIGIPFDPDVLMEKLQSGMARDEAIEQAQTAADPHALPIV